MRGITKIVLETTVDPMPELIVFLFGKYEILISDEILEAMKKMHSYTQTKCGNDEFYIFHKRGRGTHIFFNFSVVKSVKENKVSHLEYVTELGVSERHEYSSNTTSAKKIYMAFKGERLRKIKKFFKSLW